MLIMIFREFFYEFLCYIKLNVHDCQFVSIPVEISIFIHWIISIDISDPNMFVDKSF